MPFRLEPGRDRKLHRLFQEAWPQRLKRGRPLFTLGDPARVVYLVRTGHVRLTVPGRPDQPHPTVEVAGPWEVFGVEALHPGGVRATGAVGGQEAVIHSLDGRRAMSAIRSSRKSFDEWVRSSTGDLARLRQALVRRTSVHTRQRLADLLDELARRFGEPKGRGVRIPHWFTHQELAEMIGSHRSTVTTTLNDWIYEGVLKESRHELVIARPDALRDLGSARREPDRAVDPKSA